MNIYLQPLWRGTLAQLVEQRTENPCVPGSIPGGTTLKIRNTVANQLVTDFLFLNKKFHFLNITNYIRLRFHTFF